SLRPVVSIVKFPHVVVEGREPGHHRPGRAVPCHRCPAPVIDAAINEHLEVLRLAVLGSAGIVKRGRHALALIWLLLHPVDKRWLRYPGCVENGGGEIDHVAELGTHLTFRLDSGWPVDDRAVARAAPV